MTAVDTRTLPRTPWAERLRTFALSLLKPSGAVYLLLIVLLIAIVVLNPRFAEPDQFIRFLQRIAPVVIVAIGQYFVIVSGEFDLSMGSVMTAQALLAGMLIGADEANNIPVLLLMLGLGLVVGLINGLIVTVLKVPSFIATLGMMLALLGAAKLFSGGAIREQPNQAFRELGRGGIRDLPIIDILPWAVVLLVAILAVAIWFSRRPFGRSMVAVGDNVIASRYTGIRVWWVKTAAFLISSTSATIAALVLIGGAGAHHTLGQGYEFIAITAVVLGGVVLGGGRGVVIAAAAGAFALEVLFSLLNFTGVPSESRAAIQGAIIIAAVAYSAASFGSRRRRGSVTSSPAGEEPTPVAVEARPAIPTHPHQGDGPQQGGL